MNEPVTDAARGAGDAPLPPQFGRYRILRLLGEGAMGRVYLARDTQLGRAVALKTPNLTEDGEKAGEQLERFYREARSAGGLNHPNICPVYDVGQIDGIHYISMAFIEGRPLAELIAPEKLLVERQILILIRKVAHALQEAHNCGIVHRDLKPANIMIDAGDEPIVTDFGLARPIYRGDETRLTRSGIILGSPAYMSPEQVEGDQAKIGPAADQYSLGVILYQLLTGRVPFQGSFASMIRKIQTEPPLPPTQLRPGISPRLEAVCLRMMAKLPGDRFSSMSAVADEMSNLLAAFALQGDHLNTIGAARNLSLTATLHRASPTPFGRRLPLIIGAVFAAVGIVLASIWALNGPRRSTGEIAPPPPVVNADRNLPPESIEPETRKSGRKIIKRVISSSPLPAQSILEPIGETRSASRCVAYSPNGKWLAAGFDDGRLAVWDVKTGQSSRTLYGHYNGVCCVVFSPDNRWLASGGYDQTVEIWDTTTWHEARTLLEHRTPIFALCFSRDGKHLASASEERTMKLWNLPSDDAISSLVRLWNVPSDHSIRTLKLHAKDTRNNHCNAMAFSPDGKQLAGVSWNTIQIWDTASGRPNRELKDTEDVAQSGAMSPDGALLAVATQRKTIKLWDTQQGSLIRSLSGHTDVVFGVAFSPDGKHIASGSEDMTVRLWNTATAREVFTFRGHEDAVYSVIFRPDGQQIASAGKDGKVRLWDVAKYFK